MTGIDSVAVIGGGIAGAATAIALTKAGIAATIYESRSVGTESTGTMLTLG
ncbi:FAD-dependent oxidoreductase [Ruania zhangjianzhongii]|uniref:FAD-dependent oxidoreductase n=1 Tax=Ruania zhangjianzhongii TaxID=2603206 RepID=UPI0011CC8E84|nr:FAD-dependent oxidoreductase [Ruania zhangjianzhongii]